MNITLLSFCLNSLTTMSPFHIINSNYQVKVSTSILNSHFSYSFTNFIFSNTNLHHTILKNNEFSHSLKSAIYFINVEEDKQNKLTIIKNKEFNNQHNEYKDASVYGDLTIATCTFKNCESENGGALFIEQDCTVILHESIFDSCKASKDGAGGFICKTKGSRTDNEVKDGQLTKVDVQYCCFQKCSVVNTDSTEKTGFGSALLLSGRDVKLFYASTVECPGNGESVNEARGAQFDIQSENVFSENVNATGGKSKYCGSIEYRESKTGSFKYQTIMDMNCQFVTSFSKFQETATVEISLCNLINNKIDKAAGEGTYPALIHVRQQSIKISSFVFLNNVFGSDGRIVSKQSQNPDLFPNVKITLSNCYANLYSVKNDEAFTTENCDFNKGDQLALNEISQLNLGECKGNVKPSELEITEKFTPSDFFTKSEFFTYSEMFSKSGEFSHSKVFSKSDVFGQSKVFTKSDVFTQSRLFAEAGPNESNKGDKLKPGAIAGIAVAAAAAVAIIAVVAVFLIRKHNMNLLEQEDLETLDSNQPTTNMENPIYNNKAGDDPFMEDFNK